MIYLRDLKEGTIKDEYEADIRKNRPDLIEALDEGEDIQIGQSFDNKDFTLV